MRGRLESSVALTSERDPRIQSECSHKTGFDEGQMGVEQGSGRDCH